MLEVLVAVGLLAVVSLIMWEAMSLTFKAREEINRVEELNHSAQVALRHLTSDIAMAYLSNHVNPTEPAGTTLFIGKQDEILFSYLGHERRRRGARESDQGIVEYLIGREDGEKVLTRREKFIPDTEPDSGGTIETLVSGVKEFRLSYWDDDNEDWKDDWRAEMEDAKDSGLGGSLNSALNPTGSKLMKMAQDEMLEKFKLPSRVYIRLVLEDEAGNEFVFETQTRIHLRLPLNF